MTRSNALLAVLAAASPLACGDADPVDVRRVILISCDTLRADRLGCYGYERPVSPSLDEFARECVVFDEAYASAPMTVPSISSLLTGLYPGEIGVTPGNSLPIPPQVDTLAELMARAGYATAAVISNPVLTLRASRETGVPQGFQYFDATMKTREKNRRLYERLAPDTTDAALQWLEGARRRNVERYFLWVHYQDPHGPYTPPEEYVERFAREPGAERVPLGRDKLGRGDIPFYQDLDGELRADVYRDRYDAEIRYFDDALGRLLGWLREHGHLEGALVVFTADHGESLGEHDYWFCHGENVHREVVRVPFLVRYPAGLDVPPTHEGGGYRRNDSLVGHVDVVPTVLAALGLPERPTRGVPLLGERLAPARVIAQDLFPDEGRPVWRAVSDGRYRLLWNDEENRYRLYDVVEDPDEENDLAQSRPELVVDLRGRLQRHLDETRPDRADSIAPPPLTADEEAMLRQLGYLDEEPDGAPERER